MVRDDAFDLSADVEAADRMDVQTIEQLSRRRDTGLLVHAVAFVTAAVHGDKVSEAARSLSLE